MLAHPHFGPVILAWREHGAVPRRAKWAATWMMLACAAILLLVMATVPSHSAWMAVLPIACMAAVGAWLWFRPEPPEREAAAPADDARG